MGDILEQIPIVSNIVQMFPSMDFEGQRLAEKLYQVIIILFSVVGFIWGFICQQFAQTVYILGAGVFLACVVTLPPWPFFRKHPLEWQESQDNNTGNVSGKKRDKKNN